jgi:hypothetical protein
MSDTVELCGAGEPFPYAVAVKPERPSAKFLSACEISGVLANGYNFGMDSKKCAEVLRKVADAIESGDVILQDGKVYSAVSHSDFPMTTLHLKFYETGKVPSPTK